MSHDECMSICGAGSMQPKLCFKSLFVTLNSLSLILPSLQFIDRSWQLAKPLPLISRDGKNMFCQVTCCQHLWPALPWSIQKRLHPPRWMSCCCLPTRHTPCSLPLRRESHVDRSPGKPWGPASRQAKA